MALEVGSRLGTYQILGLLGAGGMGEVYRARDHKLGREVAIKVLPEDLAADQGRIARFDREARMLAAVNHPSIAAIYGAEVDGGTHYIAMELVEGDTLQHRLATGPLPVADALRVASQIAEALEVAHAKGVVHRDLKPANIKITPEGRVKVLDFGLAKAMDLPFAGDMSRSPTISLGDSRPGEVLGTPEFMSPEQARGRETDRRTDIWSLGCILYEMLSGRRAFTGETVPDAVSAILNTEPDWKALPPRTPPRVRELLARCLQKDPSRRLRDAGDARLEIEAALLELSSGGERAPAASRRRRIVVAGVVIAAIAVAALLLLRAPRVRSMPREKHLAVLPFRNLTGKPDGELLGLGLAATVSARLGSVPGLMVVTPRATAETYERDRDFARIAERLGASLVLEATLQRENDRFRITYRLLDARGTQISANVIDGLELFPLQDRVADGIARDLHLGPMTLTPTPSGLETPQQQERYLQAIGLLQRYDRRDFVERALPILRGLAEERPGSALVRAALGRANLAMFEFTRERPWADRAAADAEAARALDATLPEVDVIVGQTQLATGRVTQAREAFRRSLAVRPGDVEALLGLGQASMDAGDDAAAEDAFRRAVERQPSYLGAYNHLGAFYAGRGRWAEAVEVYRRAARVAPDSYRVFSNLGGVSVMRCDFAAALEAFRKARELAPDDPIGASNLGMTQLWMGRPAEAVVSLERAVRGVPNDYRLRANLADAYHEGPAGSSKAAPEYARSIELAREELARNPKDAVALSFLATNLAKTGKLEDGATAMRKALALDGKNPNVLSDAAVVSALAGKKSEALGWLRKAVAAGYCREIIARQPEFAKLQEDPEFRSIVAAPRPAAGS